MEHRELSSREIKRKLNTLREDLDILSERLESRRKIYTAYLNEFKSEMNENNNSVRKSVANIVSGFLSKSVRESETHVGALQQRIEEMKFRIWLILMRGE